MSVNVLIWPLFSKDRENAVMDFGFKFTAVISRMSPPFQYSPHTSPDVQALPPNPHQLETTS